nr:hypothetical protein [Tanacetum cinerariifolium]
MNDIASSLYHSLHPSRTPPLLPIPISTPSTSCRAGIPEADTPPRNRPLLATPRPGCEVKESSAAAARRALEARVAVLETHACRLEWQRQAADDLVVQYIMRTQALEAGARDDTLEDTGDHCTKQIIQIMARTRRGQTTPTKPNNITPKSVQTMVDQAFLRNSGSGDGSHSSHAENPRNMHIARPCYYADFMKLRPLNFKGTEGAVGFTRWIEKMESVCNISGCAVENQVKFATCTLLDATLTWWNSQIRTLGPDAYTMTWSVLKKKMTDKYCPLGKVKKLEIELWNLKVDKYISGLPDNIYGNVKSSKHKTLDKTIELANDLMDQKLYTYAKRKSDSKRKVDDISKNNQQPFKRQNVTKAYNLGSAEKRNYEGNAPKRTKCQRNHSGPCTLKCHKCGKIIHYARDCRSTGNTNATN